MFGNPYELSGPNSCQPCNCNKNGSQNEICSHDGICNCMTGYYGDKCDDCQPGFFPFPDCSKGTKDIL